MSHRPRRQQSVSLITRLLCAAGAVALAAGAALLLDAGLTPHHAPQPPASAAIPAPVAPTGSAPDDPSRTGTRPSSSSQNAAPQPLPTARGGVLSRSVPVSLHIPAIRVDSAVQQLGLNPDGTAQVPPFECHSPAGWYKYSPTPGQRGPAVILGHVDTTACGASVFFRLGRLRPGDTVAVTRADHTVAVFRIEKVDTYTKARFPTQAVYGNTDEAALRLITCGGTFDPKSLTYDSNIVAYAALVSAHHT